MEMKTNWLYAGAAVLGAVLLWRPAAPFDIHAELQQRLLEAELGSATTFHFAGRRMPVAAAIPADALLVNLSAAQPETRWQAARALAERRDPRAVEAVVRAMQDPAGTLRVCVMASALGHLHDPRALSALTEAAFDPGNRDLRLCAIQSLGMIGDRRAVPALIAAINTRNNPVTAANAIARMGDERGIAPMIAAAGDPQLRLWMVMALGELSDPEASAYLASLTDDPAAAIRQAAVEARWKIAQLSAPDPVQSLVDVLDGEAPPARRTWAAFRLGELGQSGAIPGLLQALADPERAVRGRAAAALIRLGQPAVPAVRQAAVYSSGPEQRYATAILGYSGGQAELSLLQSLARTGTGNDLAAIAVRSIDLINRLTRPPDGIVELANI